MNNVFKCMRYHKNKSRLSAGLVVLHDILLFMPVRGKKQCMHLGFLTQDFTCLFFPPVPRNKPSLKL